MKTETIIIIVTVIFSLTMLVSGFIAYRFPLAWEKRAEAVKYPRFDGKDAVINKGCWYFAQHTYGKAMMIAGIINVLISVVLVWLLLGNLGKWQSSNEALLAVIIICIPSVGLVLGVNRFTETKLSKRMEQ